MSLGKHKLNQWDTPAHQWELPNSGTVTAPKAGKIRSNSNSDSLLLECKMVQTLGRHFAGFILTKTIRQEQEIKGSQIRGKEVHFCLFAMDTISYTENAKKCTKKLSELTNESRIAKNNLSKEKQSWRANISQFHNVLQVRSGRGSVCWHKYKQRDEWNIIRRPETNSHVYDKWVFNRGVKKFNRKRIVFSASGAGTTGSRHAGEWRRPFCTTHATLQVDRMPNRTHRRKQLVNCHDLEVCTGC